MKKYQEWVLTETVIQVKALEKGELLPDNVAVFTDAARKLIGLSSGDKLFVFNHYHWPSKHKYELIGFGLKLEKSSRNSPSSSPNDVLYMSGEDFGALCNAINFSQSSNAIEGVRLEAIPDKPAMVNMVCLSREDALALAGHLEQSAAILRKSVMPNGFEEAVNDEKVKDAFPAAVKKCFKDPDARLYDRIKRVLEQYRDSHTTLARLEIALEDLGELKYRKKHKVLADALMSWGLINDASKSRCAQMSGAYLRIEENKEEDSVIEDIKRIIKPLSRLPH